MIDVCLGLWYGDKHDRCMLGLGMKCNVICLDVC